MKIELATPISKTPDWLKTIESEYISKIGHLKPFNVHKITTKKISRDQSELKKKLDDEAIASLMNEPGYHLVFDERGEDLTSMQFSELITSLENQGQKSLRLYIGGPFGMTQSTLHKATRRVALSKFVLNHWIAYLVVLEQLYRAIAIQKNLPYHNE